MSILATGFTLVSCSAHTEATVDSAMRNYDRVLMSVNADSIAMLYTKDGELGANAKGREAIKMFLSNFKDIRIEKQISTTKSIIIAGDTAIQKGSYEQAGKLPGDKKFNVKGEYTAKWAWDSEKGWLLKHMETNPK